MAQANLRGSTAVAAAPANPQARGVRTAAETAVRPELPQAYYEAQSIRSGQYGLPANSGNYKGTWTPGSAPNAQNAWDLSQAGLKDPKSVSDPDSVWGKVQQGLDQYFTALEKYNALVGSGPGTKPRAATAPVEERSAAVQSRRRGSPETIMTAGWGLDDKPKTQAKVLLGG